MAPKAWRKNNRAKAAARTKAKAAELKAKGLPDPKIAKALAKKARKLQNREVRRCKAAIDKFSEVTTPQTSTKEEIERGGEEARKQKEKAVRNFDKARELAVIADSMLGKVQTSLPPPAEKELLNRIYINNKINYNQKNKN